MDVPNCHSQAEKELACTLGRRETSEKQMQIAGAAVQPIPATHRSAGLHSGWQPQSEHSGVKFPCRKGKARASQQNLPDWTQTLWEAHKSLKRMAHGSQRVKCCGGAGGVKPVPRPHRRGKGERQGACWAQGEDGSAPVWAAAAGAGSISCSPLARRVDAPAGMGEKLRVSTRTGGIPKTGRNAFFGAFPVAFGFLTVKTVARTLHSPGGDGVWVGG